jgi:hypothetical protein
MPYCIETDGIHTVAYFVPDNKVDSHELRARFNGHRYFYWVADNVVKQAEKETNGETSELRKYIVAFFKSNLSGIRFLKI